MDRRNGSSTLVEVTDFVVLVVLVVVLVVVER